MPDCLDEWARRVFQEDAERILVQFKVLVHTTDDATQYKLSRELAAYMMINGMADTWEYGLYKIGVLVGEYRATLKVWHDIEAALKSRDLKPQKVTHG
jgi:hypothetical protein